MARPTKYADAICGAGSLIAVAGVLLGLWLRSPLVVVVALVPSVAYEAYRTEGRSTRWASWMMAGVLALEFVFIVFGVSFNLSEFLSATEQEVAGYSVPLGDIKLVAPVLMAVLSVILIARTRGRYTRWLAVNVLIGVLALTYLIDPEVTQELLREGMEQGAW